MAIPFHDTNTTEPVDGFPQLEYRRDSWRRQPYVRARNLAVGQLVWKMEVNKVSPAAAVAEYDLTREQIEEALRYAQEHPDVVAQDEVEEQRRLRARLHVV